MRFGFLLKRGKPEAAELARELSDVLRARGCEVVVGPEDHPALPDARVVEQEDFGGAIDVLVVLGGDGTFLYGASLVADHGVPLLGVNLGSLGFITPYVRGEAAAGVFAACEGRLPVEERMRLGVTVHTEGRPDVTRAAVNDAVLNQAAMARLLDLEARVDGEKITLYKADGLILATPTGSTAYSLAAGGPILSPNLEALVLTPICPHTLTNRPLVLSAKGTVTVHNVAANTAQLTLDGQWSCLLGRGDWIEVRKLPQPLRIFRSSASFFTILQRKLAWGERSG